MSTKFSLTRDINGFNGFGLAFTDVAYSCTLTTVTSTPVVVPTLSNAPGGTSYAANAKPKLIAIFAYDPGSSVWVNNSPTIAAAAPGGSSFAATISELNPSARYVSAGDTLNFFTTDMGINVWVGFYWIGQ